MGIIRRGGYVFVSWIGDHKPRHMHIYRRGRLLLKWNLEIDEPMGGVASRHLRAIISSLKKEGRI